MAQTLQVNFRRLIPCEQLVQLAKQRCDELRLRLSRPSECLVSLERREVCAGALPFALTDARVQIVREGGPHREAHAVHRDPARALTLALAQLQAALDADCVAWN